MEYLLQLKIGALFGLLLLTLLVETHRTVLSLISCFAGGVFLAACLLDILPDYLYAQYHYMTKGLEHTNITGFPIPEFILAGGFFIVLVLEKLVLHCQERRVHAGEREPLLQGNGHGHGHGEVVRPELESRGHHIHVDLQAHSPFRSFMLFLSLSLHSVFEGLAIGLQNTDSKVRAGNQRLLSAVVLYIKVSQSGITVLVVVVVISG
uniref:Solute carrier family 39 member 1 n=1 Tax=Periophthalmus magnuspinnatus TaxID=409849 RepID=A0A3B3ZIC1_9GOBI